MPANAGAPEGDANGAPAPMATPANPDPEPSYNPPSYGAEPPRARVQGPGDDRFPPPERVAGPGDAHDWPWNRQQSAAAAPAAVPAEPIRVGEPAPAPVETAVPPTEDDPNRPKKRGWWNRLTG